MSEVNGPIGEIAHAMQTAVAPVFLISGAGTLLAAMSFRYGRAIDRARTVLRDYTVPGRDAHWRTVAEDELKVLYRRAKLLRMTIIFNVASIFCISLCIFLLFASLMLDFALPYVVPGMFTLAILLLTVSLALFIEDFAISLSGLRYEIKAVLQKDILRADKSA